MAASVSILLAFLACVNVGSLLMASETPQKKCRYSRGYSLLQVQCQNINLKDIPKNLQSNIQVLDLSDNKVRILKNESLAKYTSLAFLYLQENAIRFIEEAALVPLESLEVLDISTNSISDLPKSLFDMAHLRTLYVADNSLDDVDMERSDIQAPLSLLQVSKNRLTRLPKLYPLPKLRRLNVSENNIEHIPVEDIARLCSLQELDVTGNHLKFDRHSCECHKFKAWIEAHAIEVRPAVSCPIALNENCSQIVFTNRTLEEYNACTSTLAVAAQMKKVKSTWTWIASCVGVFIVCVSVALFFVHRRNRKRRQHWKAQQNVAANHTNVELLHGNGDQEITDIKKKPILVTSDANLDDTKDFL